MSPFSLSLWERVGVRAITHPAQRASDHRARALRVRAAFRADAERAAFGRRADARPPSFPPLRFGEWSSGFPYPPPPGFSPPLWILCTVAHARRWASFLGMPRRS